MFYGSDEFNSAIENTHGNAPKTRLKFADDEILDLVSSIRYYGGSNDSDDVSIGTTTMARVEVSAYTDKLLTNREFFLEQGIELANGVVEYMPIGYFVAQKPQGDIDEVRFTAYDRMQKFEKPYSSNLAYPTTSILILDELCQICGIELATTLDNAIEVTENLKGYTCREVLGYIASMHSSFACIDRYGRLNLRWYSDTPIEKSLKKIWHFEKSQDNFEIAKVEIAKNSETNYVSGSGITTLHNSNPLATQEITDDIFAKLGGFSYSVGEIEMLDDARLDPWDMVSVEYYDGKRYNIPCMSLEHDFKAYSTTVKSVGKSESENEYRFTGPTIQYLNRMAADLLVANRVIATKVDAEYVQSHAITTDNLDAIQANITSAVIQEVESDFVRTDSLDAIQAQIKDAVIEDLDVDFVTAEQLEAINAQIGLLDTDIAGINTLIFGSATGDVIQTSFANAVIAQLGDAQIKSAMIQDVSASKITAGDIITNNVRVMSEDGSLLISDETMQISDENRVRVQIGKDANGDYSINIWDADGNLMFSQGGITDSAIKSAIIRNNMVSDTANISAHKLDIDSLFEEINGSTNTIKATQIYLDDEEQTLDVSFKKMSTTVNKYSETIQSQGTQIEVVQGQITNKVWQQDITQAINTLEIGASNLLDSSKDLVDNDYFFAEYNLTDGTNQLVYSGYALCV
jgi:hypothetical protein